MEDLVDPEAKIQCPYNDSHLIRRCKMQFHLVKCKKSYTGKPMVPCDFNATHIVLATELQAHHRNCPDRRQLEASVLAQQEKTQGRFPIPKIDIVTDENWNEDNAPTYNPQEYVEHSNVLRKLDVEPSAKKREFRLNERQRLAEINNSASLARQKMILSLPKHR